MFDLVVVFDTEEYRMKNDAKRKEGATNKKAKEQT